MNPGRFSIRPEALCGSRRADHGARVYPGRDCTFLFITNKASAIHFVGHENDPEAPKV